MTARRMAQLTLLALVGALFPLVLSPAPASAATGSATGTLDFDAASLSTDSFDLGYTIEVSNTTPAAGENVTVAITWNEAPDVGAFAYKDLNICWDAPAGWAGAGPVPTTQDYELFTPEGEPVDGQVVGADVPGTPSVVADFTSASAVGERADVTSYTTDAGKVYRFCAHADTIDNQAVAGVLDNADDAAGSMTVTLEAPAAGPANFAGLLPTSAYVGDSPLETAPTLPTDPSYVPLPAPQTRTTLGSAIGGFPFEPMRYDYDDTGDATSTPIVVTPSGSLLTYSVDTQGTHGVAVVDPDGSFTYTPTDGYEGEDTFVVKVSDGDGFSLSTVTVTMVPNVAAVTVTKSADETSVLVGEDIHYTIDVANSGGVTIHDITLADPNAPGCATTIDALAFQEHQTVECTYTPVAGDVGTYSNVATASSADLAAPAASNQVDVSVENAGTPRVEIRATTTQTSVEAGSDLVYEIEVTNTGGVVLTGVAVTDPNAPNCARSIGSLSIGARSVYECTLTTTSAMVGNRSNVATVDSNETDPVSAPAVVVPVTADDGVTSVPYVCDPGISDPINTNIPITANDDVDPAQVGSAVQWTFRNANPSIDVGVEADLNWIRVDYARPTGLSNVTLDLVNPPGQTVNPPMNQITPTVTAGVVRFQTPNSGTIHVTAAGALTYNGQPVVLPMMRVTGTPTEALRNTVIQWRAPKILVDVQTLNVGNVPCDPPNPSPVVLRTTVAPANPILDVDKSVSQGVALPDQVLTYTLLVRNRGNVGLTGVSVVDALVPDCDATIGALAAGGSQTITCERTTTAEDEGRLRNTAIADSDQTPAVTSNPADTVVSLTAVSGLDATVVADSPDVAPGDAAEWTITIQNTGNTDLTGVALDATDSSTCDEQTVPTTVAVGTSVTVECETPTTGLLQPFAVNAFVENAITVTADDTDPVTPEGATVRIVIPASGWTDLADWYAPAGDWLDFWDLADGFNDGTQFRGTRSITRGEFLRMVYRLAGEPAGPNPPTHHFTDVPNWIADAVAWAADDPAGDEPPLMTGLTATRFGATQPITRGQAVRLLFRFADRIEPQVVPDPPTHAFTDVPAWVADAVAWAADDPDGGGSIQPLVTGLTPTRFGPGANITRAQVARLLYRLSGSLDL